jgi:hypothetical protein
VQMGFDWPAIRLSANPLLLSLPCGQEPQS